LRYLGSLLFILWINSVFGQSYGNYYDEAKGLREDALKTALYTIIKGHTEYDYTSSSTDVWDILKVTDRDPNNSANVILIYTGRSVNAAQEYNSGSGWSREHVWAKSRGDFGTDRGPGTDVHHLRPADISVNSTRNNRSFDNCHTCIEVWDEGVFSESYYDASEWTFEPRDEVKGDVARMIFYMAVRYEGENGEPNLELTENLPTLTDKNPLHGRLSTLLAWNRFDPVSEWERNRNEIIFNQFQHNRNPFIDIPELAEYIWGNEVGLVWSPLGTSNTEAPQFKVYPNPSNGTFYLETLKQGSLKIFNLLGTCVYEQAVSNYPKTELQLESGIYFLQYTTNGQTQTQKLIIR